MISDKDLGKSDDIAGNAGWSRGVLSAVRWHCR